MAIGEPPANCQESGQGGGGFAGEFRGSGMRLVLAPAGNGTLTGTIYFQQSEMPAVVRQQSPQYAAGSFTANGGTFPFDLTREGVVVTLSTQGNRYRLTAMGGAAAASPNPGARRATPVNPLSTGAPPEQQQNAPDASQGYNPGRAARPQANAAPAGGIVGTWRSATGTMRFNSDGTGIANGEEFRYQTEGGILTMANSQGSVRLAYQVQANSMTLTGPGGSVVLERADGNNRGASGGVAAGQGTVAQELVGKWCYVSNVNATGGGARASNQCFVLYPDGRYEYSGETDSYGRAGGSTSQSSDRGTWTATESSLTARSVTGKVSTYGLQRRNHPKNNDPMLVLDGQAFVTYYQKPPWRY